MVDINFLEEKEKPNIAPYLLIAVGVLVLGLALLFITFEKNSLIAEDNQIQEDIVQIKDQQTLLTRDTLTDVQKSRNELKDTVSELNQVLIPSVPVLKDMISLLPERGFFLEYQFQKPNVLTMQVRFDGMQDVASYTNALTTKSYTEDVQVTTIDTTAVEEGDYFETLPRYVAEFEMLLNPVASRALLQVEEETDVEEEADEGEN